MTTIYEISRRAVDVLKKNHFSVSDPATKGRLRTASASCETEHGGITFNLLIGELSASEHQEIADFKVFCPALSEAIELTKDFRADVRLAIFRGDFPPSQYLLEILLFTFEEGEVVLSLELKDYYFDRKHIDSIERFVLLLKSK